MHKQENEKVQNWEYKFIEIARSPVPPIPTLTGQIGGWATQWSVNMETESKKLGAEGWELVTIVPRSGYLEANGSNFNQFTLMELWVFKRPQKQF